MQGGDISNEVSPRLVVVWEGMLGIPTEQPAAIKTWARKIGRNKEALLKRAVAEFEINEPLAKVIWDTVWRHQYSVDVVTYLGDPFARALEKRLDDENLPIGRVWAAVPHLLAREIAYMPDLAAIFDNENYMVYGSKGRTLPANATSLIGAF